MESYLGNMMDRRLTFSQCDQWLKMYHESYRHPSLDILKFSACYLLYEVSLIERAPLEIESLLISHWPKPWVDAGKCGVYLTFDENFATIFNCS